MHKRLPASALLNKERTNSSRVPVVLLYCAAMVGLSISTFKSLRCLPPSRKWCLLHTSLLAKLFQPLKKRSKPALSSFLSRSSRSSLPDGVTQQLRVTVVAESRSCCRSLSVLFRRAWDQRVGCTVSFVSGHQ